MLLFCLVCGVLASCGGEVEVAEADVQIADMITRALDAGSIRIKLGEGGGGSDTKAWFSAPLEDEPDIKGNMMILVAEDSHHVRHDVYVRVPISVQGHY